MVGAAHLRRREVEEMVSMLIRASPFPFPNARARLGDTKPLGYDTTTVTSFSLDPMNKNWIAFKICFPLQ